MKRARVRVEAKNYNPHASYDEQYKSFKGLFQAFKRACNQAGILKDYKRHEAYEKPGEKKRRKQKELRTTMLKAKLRENFTEKRENE